MLKEYVDQLSDLDNESIWGALVADPERKYAACLSTMCSYGIADRRLVFYFEKQGRLTVFNIAKDARRSLPVAKETWATMHHQLDECKDCLDPHYTNVIL